MKRLCTALLMLCWLCTASAIERSKTIVYINGAKYYIHAVAAGETLYSLAKAYDVSEEVITHHNRSAADGLKAGETLKIPVAEQPTNKPEPSERKLNKTFSSHYVVKGETLYGIARTYEIAVQTIIEDNPDIDPTHLSPGQRILIRKKGIGKSNAAESEAQWSAYNEQLNSVAPEGEQYYVVQKGDTFYSLARRYGISEEELSTLNNGLQAVDLKVGAILRLPQPEEGQTTTETIVENPIQEVASSREVEFRALCNCDPLRVSLLLPMSNGRMPNPNYMDFYEGFLLGLDSVRTRYGHSVDLTLYDTKRDTNYLKGLCEQDAAFRMTQLIIGPVYEEELQVIVPFAEHNTIPTPVVSPLAHIEELQSDVLFQMAPDPAKKYDKAQSLLDGKRITFIYGESNDRAFEEEMLALLGERPHTKHEYRYVHPSVKLKEDELNPSDLSPILDNEEENLYFILSDNEIEVDRILAALASADTNLRARSLRTPKYSVFGNSRWNRYTNIDRTIFFKNRVVFFTTYHAKRDAEVVADFDRAYIRAFGSLPSLYSYRGYDAAMIFVPAMFNDIEYDLEDRRYEPLKTLYRFKQTAPTANHVNQDWMRVNYNSDFTITIE